MKLIVLALLLLPLALAQQQQPVTSTQPDCGRFVQAPITTAGTFTFGPIDNRAAACDGWVVTYSSNGFATVSVLLQSAPLGVGGVAGTFVSFAGTITAGYSNPTTATTQGEIRATGYFPYVNVQVTTTGSGYLVGEVHGFKTNPNAGGTTAIVGTPNVNIIQGGGNPVIACNQQALFNLSGASNTQIIALSGTLRTFICHIDFATTAAEDVKLTSGTGSNCAGATADVTGLYKSISAMAQDYQAFAPLVIPSGQATCINQSAGQALGGVVIFAQAP